MPKSGGQSSPPTFRRSAPLGEPRGRLGGDRFPAEGGAGASWIRANRDCPLGRFGEGRRRCPRGRPISCRNRPLGVGPPSELPVVGQRPPVVRNEQFADHRQSRPPGRRGYRKRGEPVVRCSTEAIAQRARSTWRGRLAHYPGNAVVRPPAARRPGAWRCNRQMPWRRADPL